MVDMFAKNNSHLAYPIVNGQPKWHEGDLYDCGQCSPEQYRLPEEDKRLLRFWLRAGRIPGR